MKTEVVRNPHHAILNSDQLVSLQIPFLSDCLQVCHGFNVKTCLMWLNPPCFRRREIQQLNQIFLLVSSPHHRGDCCYFPRSCSHQSTTDPLEFPHPICHDLSKDRQVGELIKCCSCRNPASVNHCCFGPLLGNHGTSIHHTLADMRVVKKSIYFNFKHV